MVISRAMRIVDSDTRQEVRVRRLLSLEADNYNDEVGGGNPNDDAYDISSDDGNGEGEGEGDEKKHKKRAVAATAGGASSSVVKRRAGSEKDCFSLQRVKDKWASRRPRSIDKIVDEYQQQIARGNPENDVTFVSATVHASRRPARHFCSVCGYQGKYACVRCGMRYVLYSI